MILMTQKNKVTSGTLFNISRPRPRRGWPAVTVGLFMPAMVRAGGLRVPERLGAERGQLEHEAAARPGARDDVAPARARQTARQREPEPGARRVVVAARPGVERPLAERRVEPRTVVADRQPDTSPARRQLEGDVVLGVAARVVDQ